MRLFRRFTQKGQTGQSLVILAIGFLALLGFVGIVTDISVLFIRYSTMRRAIDAAAIAAAGQMRRVVDEDLESLGIADGQAMSVANLNLAARQFIEVYGLNPRSVIVETCRAQQVARDVDGNALDTGGGRLFDDAGNVISSDAALVERYRELCTEDELKLVRVTAQIDAPTIFLRLFGYPTVTLTESAISQTAVIDVVLIFDVSESMLNETTYDDWDTLSPNPQGVRYIPPRTVHFAEPGVTADDPWDLIPSSTQSELNAYIDPNLATINAVINDKTLRYETGSTLWSPATTLQEYIDPASSPIGRVEPREFCRVRAYPSSTARRARVPLEQRYEYADFLTNVYAPHAAINTLYADGITPYLPTYSDKTLTFTGNPANDAWHIGFVPMYNFYGCCNDPDGDFEFDDLICQPFKEARDAAEGFLARLDFLRGDRVGFVTFNREAYLVDPDGVEADGGGPQSFMIETENDLYAADGTTLLRKGAVETLRSVVGVMAENSHYRDTNNDGLWDHLFDGYGDIGAERTYAEFDNTRIGEIVDHPVENSCPFDKAILDVELLMSEERINPDGTPRTLRLLQSLVTIPGWYFANGGISSPPAAAPIGTGGYLYQNYEYKASCAGTNIGGALAGGSLMLWEEGRREGAVWIMVLLSDGAAGASNPIYTVQGTNVTGAQPYYVTGTALDPQPGTGPASIPAGYGFYGLCPYGTEARFTNAATDIRSQPQLLVDSNFPTCSDLYPDVRHYCGSVAAVPSSEFGSVLDGDNFAATDRCIDFYDVDDYARDWADWVGVSDLPGAATGGTTGRVADQLLPTIFTIGFGINYGDDTPVVCATDACTRGLETGTNDSPVRQRDRNSDYLGEELLRYIADVGDNFQIDSDYFQLCASQTAAGHTTPCLLSGFSNAQNRIGNWIDVTNTSPNWGVRGPCEAPATGLPADRGNTFLPTDPATSCGNYFAAPSGAQLQEVFNQIASRMFTRLSQ